MTDDLVTRLRALADEMDFGWRPPLLREAAEALDSRMTSIIDPNIRALEQERDDLKAKLAMGMQSIDSAWKVSYEKAEAEAAALREALNDIAFWRCGCGATWASDKAKQALSQPGPGAALLGRVKKLEAVAVAVKANAALFSDDEPLTFENCEPIRLALAALEEKA